LDGGGGVGKGDFLAGVGIHSREDANELLEFNEFPERLPEDAIVLDNPQGYNFWFIRAFEGDDPPVYYWVDSMTQPPFQVSHRHFSDYLLYYLKIYEERLERYAKEIGVECGEG